jgi:sugar phosphate isomerase/epimerase
MGWPAASDVGLCIAALLPDFLSCDTEAFTAIVDAAALAGFRDVSVWPIHAPGLPVKGKAAVLAAAGVRARVVEAATRWTRGPSRGFQADASALFELAAAVGATTVAACTLEPALGSWDAAVSGWAALCDGAAERGLGACLEFLPWTAIPDLATAWRLVGDAGRGNGGILLDTWHWLRQPGGPDVELLASIPGGRIPFVQLSDAPAAVGGADAGADLATEALTARLAPGDGVIDYRSVFEALDRAGAEPFVALEVMNTQMAAAGPAAMAQTLRRALEQWAAVPLR